jgi:hypothetical protein
MVGNHHVSLLLLTIGDDVDSGHASHETVGGVVPGIDTVLKVVAPAFQGSPRAGSACRPIREHARSPKW